MVVLRDVPNLLRYRGNAPRWAQRIWVDPSTIKDVVFGLRNDRSGELVSGWEGDVGPVAELPKVRASVAHWCEDVPWSETGVFKYLRGEIERNGSYDGCQTIDQLHGRYAAIDEMFERVKSERRIRTRRELNGRRAFRELGGIRVHIGPRCEPVFGGAGQHRLAMAQVLRLPEIPAQLGVVHPDALHRWKLLAIRH